jgi:hypothetical protein
MAFKLKEKMEKALGWCIVGNFEGRRRMNVTNVM